MKKGMILFLGLAGVFLLFPAIAQADNCSFFADCFNTAKAAAAAATAMGIIAAIASAAADLTPGVGELKAGTQLLTGKDPITNKEVPRWQSAIGLIPVFGRVAAGSLRYGMAAARARGAMQTARGLRTAARGLNTGIDIYETARQPYDFATTVRDTAQDITGQIHDFMGQSSTEQPRAVNTVRGMGNSNDNRAPQIYVARAVPFDIFAKMLNSGFHSVSDSAPATVADKTLTSLVKTFGKNSDVLKNIAKAKDKIGDLPKEATMKDVLTKLKE